MSEDRPVVSDYHAARDHRRADQEPPEESDGLAMVFRRELNLVGTFQDVYERVRQQEHAAIETVAPIVAELSSVGSVSTTPDVELDQATLKALLSAMYSDREAAENSGYSDLVDDLASVDVRGVCQSANLLRVGDEAARQSEADWPPGDEDEAATDFDVVGFAREALYDASPGFKNLVDRRLEDLLKRGHEAAISALDHDAPAGEK